MAPAMGQAETAAREQRAQDNPAVETTGRQLLVNCSATSGQLRSSRGSMRATFLGGATSDFSAVAGDAGDVTFASPRCPQGRRFDRPRADPPRSSRILAPQSTPAPFNLDHLAGAHKILNTPAEHRLQRHSPRLAKDYVTLLVGTLAWRKSPDRALASQCGALDSA